MIRRTPNGGGATVLGRVLGFARGIVVLGVVLAVLVPALATSAVVNSGVQESCHGTGIDVVSPLVAGSHAFLHGDPAGTACAAAACAVPGCMSGALPVLSASVRHDGVVLAVRLEGAGQPVAGITASPGHRPPIGAIAV